MRMLFRRVVLVATLTGVQRALPKKARVAQQQDKAQRMIRTRSSNPNVYYGAPRAHVMRSPWKRRIAYRNVTQFTGLHCTCTL